MASSISKKKINVIHRTTSETIRLSETDILDETVHIPSFSSTLRTNQSIHFSRKKVQSSFQITDVCLTRPDVGDESADDLDESHTDDNSRVTDNETPSFSEDSRDAEEHATLATICLTSTAPTTAPISSTSTTRSKEEKSRSLSSDSPNSNSFSRGRWTCLDYVDNNQDILDMDLADSENFVNQYLKSSSALKNCELFFEQKFQDVLQFDNNGLTFDKDEVDDAYRRVACLLTTTEAENNTGVGGKEGPVAIDSKIEQAMDMVKSHLMYAVRQDVNVLKLKISELLVRISQLESENLYLRAKASPEVLRLLERRNQTT
ncbi:hypothetical protein WA026_008736 [Henosepilachna vigintioctopunctata]|uniref:Uncharacterized protein n=1 Tax=Henosepilachna vigintioctopunctata TaxID=420089 RepID=A0AAW1VB29_9CUCU